MSVEPGSDVTVERVEYGAHPSQFFDLYLPTHNPERTRGVVVSIHGGYWRATYGLDLNNALSRHLSSEGFAVVNIEYRRSGDVELNSDAVWADMGSDVLTAIEVSPDVDGPVLVVGHSAGGHLALWAASQPGVSIDGVIALAPVTDLFAADQLRLSTHATFELFGASLADAPELYRSASPVHLLPLGVNQLVVHGKADSDVPASMSADYVEKALAAGDQVELISDDDVDHFDIIDPTHDTWRSIERWIEGAGW